MDHTKLIQCSSFFCNISFSAPFVQSVACLENASLRFQFRFSGLRLFHWLSVICESLSTGLPLSAKQVFIFFFIFLKF